MDTLAVFSKLLHTTTSESTEGGIAFPQLLGQIHGPRSRGPAKPEK